MHKMAPEIFISDQRMLQVMDWAISGNVRDVKTKRDWCDKVGFGFTNLPKVKAGKQSFTKEQLLNCAEIFNIDMNFLFGLSDIMIRAAQPTALDMLRDVVHIMEAQQVELNKNAAKKPAKTTKKAA